MLDLARDACFVAVGVVLSSGRSECLHRLRRHVVGRYVVGLVAPVSLHIADSGDARTGFHPFMETVVFFPTTLFACFPVQCGICYVAAFFVRCTVRRGPCMHVGWASVYSEGFACCAQVALTYPEVECRISVSLVVGYSGCSEILLSSC